MIIFLFGSGTSTTQKIKEFKAKFIKEVDPQADNIELIDGEAAGLSEINSKVAPRSLSGQKALDYN